MNYYDDNAEQYYKNTINFDPEDLCLMFKDGVRRFSNKPPGDMRVLDLGCGSARDSFYLSGEGFEVTGIDLSFKLLSHSVSSDAGRNACLPAGSLPAARNRDAKSAASIVSCLTSPDGSITANERAGGPRPVRPSLRPNFLCADFLKLPFKNDSFDAVFAQASLLHVPKKNIAAVINEVNRVTRPGGLIYFSVKEGSGESLDTAGRFFAYYDREEMAAKFSGNGFSIVDFQRKPSRDGLNNEAVWLMYLALKPELELR